LDLNLRKKLVKCYIWFYGAENCTLRKVDRKYLGSFNCCAGEEWRRSVGRIVRGTKYNIELRRTDVAGIDNKRKEC
jgi:hypothetical protein